MRNLILLLVLALAGCASGASGDELASDLWAEIDGYDGWAMPEGWTDTPVLSGGHSGSYVVAYYNSTLAAWDVTGDAPEGSIAVKESFDDVEGTTLSGLTVMKKIAGYDADANDWFWASFAADGTVGSAGKVEMCSGCHASAAQDYVLTDPPTGE